MAQALSGIKVIDLTRVLAGPFATQILADHGAHVIKIEPPQGDETRQWGPPFNKNGDASYFLGANRNKQSISIDLSHPQGQQILFDLLKKADVLIENFKTGTLKKWGLDYETILQKKFPKLIHCSITGFGEKGPFAHKVGYDAVAQALTGVTSINGIPGQETFRLAIPIIDLSNGLFATIGVLLALQEREKSGKGQSVSTNLYDSGLSILYPQAINYLTGKKEQKPVGNAHPNICPYSQFHTKTGAIFIGCGNDKQFLKLCEELGKPDIAHNPKYKTNADRLQHKEDLLHELQMLLIHHDAQELSLKLLDMGIPAGKVSTVSQVINHPQTTANQMIVSLEDYQGVASPIHLSRTEAQYHTTPPCFSHDTQNVLEALGYDQEKIIQLTQEKIIFSQKC